MRGGKQQASSLRLAERLAARHDVGCRPRWTEVSPARPSDLHSTRWWVIVTAVEPEVHDYGSFVIRVGLAIAPKQAWREHELFGCSGQDMVPGGERPEATLSRRAGAPVEEPLPGGAWQPSRIEAAEVLAVAAPGGDGTPHGIEETREQTRPLDGCDVQARP